MATISLMDCHSDASCGVGELGVGQRHVHYLEELGDDGDRGNVDEAAGREGEDPVGKLSNVGGGEAQGGSKHGANGSHELQLDGLGLGAASLDEDGKVADFVWDLR
jgi:hypothetical protein